MEMNGQEKRSSGSVSTQASGTSAHNSVQILLQKMDGVAVCFLLFNRARSCTIYLRYSYLGIFMI